MAKDPDLVRKAPDKWSNLHGTVKVDVRERLTIFNRVKGKSTVAILAGPMRLEHTSTTTNATMTNSK